MNIFNNSGVINNNMMREPLDGLREHDDQDEKRKRRLERNRESARECRKRKKDRLQQIKQSISRLETDNLQLRIQLQIGPESEKYKQDEAKHVFGNLSSMLSTSTDEEIRKSVADIQERFADYGRTQRSAVSFHISQLARCLLPTQTTRTIIWLVNNFPLFYRDDGSLKLRPSEAGLDEVSSLWYDLHHTLNPTADQSKKLLQLAVEERHIKAEKSVDNPSRPSDSSGKDSEDSEAMLKRLDELLSEKNDSLDHEMSQIQHILSASQIAKFLIWINKNPAVMQMLEALWPHLTSEAGS